MYVHHAQVLQVGYTKQDQYIHRLGRTARGSDSVEGRGIILVADYEYKNMPFIRGQGISDLPPEDMLTLQKDATPALKKALTDIEDELKGQAYQAWLGFNNSNKNQYGWTSEMLVQKANEFAKDIDA